MFEGTSIDENSKYAGAMLRRDGVRELWSLHGRLLVDTKENWTTKGFMFSDTILVKVPSDTVGITFDKNMELSMGSEVGKPVDLGGE